MTTGTQIIERSARLIGVKASGQSLAADKTAAFLEALNAMLVRWEADGLGMGFSPLTAATSTISIPVENEEAVAYNLAVLMAPEYGREPSSYVARKADEGLRALERDVIKPVAVALDLPCAEGGSGAFDINTGS